jgi:hypothetical protein
MRYTAESRDRKWYYFRLVCAWVGVGGVLKLATMQAVHVAREAELRRLKTEAVSMSEGGLLSPVAQEDLKRREPRPPMLQPR